MFLACEQRNKKCVYYKIDLWIVGGECAMAAHTFAGRECSQKGYFFQEGTWGGAKTLQRKFGKLLLGGTSEIFTV
jgi:hypothetical protein